MKFELKTGEKFEMKIKSVSLRRKSHDERSSIGVLSIWEEGESVLDNLENRHFRPYNFYRQLAPEISSFIKHDPKCQKFIKDAGAEYWFVETDYLNKMKWSQRAGCRCGCSPGFKLQSLWYYNIGVTIKLKVLK
jgi:hypothetical protein